MAQSGFTPILLYASGTASAAPTAGNLTSSASGAELALNYADGKLFYKDNAGAVQVLAVKMPSGVLPVANGGTGASTFTANGVIYGNTAGALQVTAAGTTGQVLVGNTGSAPSWGAATGVAVTSLSFGTTGLTPNTATQGAITVAGTLAVANGGTGITSFGTGVATALGQNVSGSGGIALTTSPSFTTPTLGVASATSVNKVAITAPATAATLTLSDGSSLITSGGHSLTLTTTGATNVTFPTSGTLATTGGTVASFSAGTTGFTPNTATTGAVTLAGTLATTNGGTGLTSFTANGVVYASSTSALATGSALTFDGTNLGVPADVYRTSDTSFLQLSGGNGAGTGANVLMFGSTHATNPNRLSLNAPNATATSYIDFGVAGVEAMRLTSTGLGIGTSSPTSRLTIGTGTYSAAASGTTGMYTTATGLEMLSDSYFFGARTGGIRMALDASGNLGLGVTPSAWRSGARAFQSGANGYLTLWEQSNGSANLGFAVYENAANTFAYTTTGDSPTLYSQLSGAHKWYTAPSGTAGNAISFTQAMTLDASGHLSVGTTSVFNSTGGRGNLSLNGSSSAMYNLGVNNASAGYVYHSGTDMWINNVLNGIMSFYTNNTERARITSTGNVVAGGSVALATNATDGFLYVPTCAGTPTGTPTAITGMAPIVVDTTNNKLYFYSGGQWRDAGP